MREAPADAAAISLVQLFNQPFFEKTPADLFSADPATAQTFADQHFYDLLSRAFPARTYGVGANPLEDAFEGSINMKSPAVQTGWPSSRGLDTNWRHSDCKNVAYQFTHKFFEEIVNLGKLK